MMHAPAKTPRPDTQNDTQAAETAAPTQTIELEVFADGTWTESSGEMTVDGRDLIDKLIANYDPVQAPAPVTRGHPEHDSPALGWVRKLWREGSKMKAALELLAPDLVADLKARRYCRPSISVFHPDRLANPRLGEPYLRHIALLGGASPAIPNLTPVVFAAPGGDAYTLNYRSVETGSEESPSPGPSPNTPSNPPSNAGTRTQWLEEKVQQGKLPPALRRHAERVLVHLEHPVEPPGASFQFSEKPNFEKAATSFRNFVEKLPPRLNRNELSGLERGGPNPQTLSHETIAAEAQAYCRKMAENGRKISTSAAVTHVRSLYGLA